ncbi:MAG: hypothetical protein GX304_01880 [Clostridiales bacterium]|jgi:hypothetical protein|nr:hypothetical protein [Clostridiales bacterium]
MRGLDRPKARIEDRFNIWVYVLALYLSFLLGSFFENGMAVNSMFAQLSTLFKSIDGYIPYSLAVIIHMVIPMLSVALFELVARVFYSISNRLSRHAVAVGANRFVAALRPFVILINLVKAVLGLFYFLFPFLIPLGLTVLSFIVESAGFFLFFVYLSRHYLDKKTADKAFMVMAIFYLLYTLLAVVL